MEELIEKVEQLKEAIGKDEKVVCYLEEKQKIFCDKNIISKVEQYKKNASKQLKDEIEHSSSFLAYKKKEGDIQLMIFAMNQKFREIGKAVDCRKE